jgi:hypothetical protein
VSRSSSLADLSISKRVETVSCSCQQFVIGSVALETNNVFQVSNVQLSTAAQMFCEECDADAHSDECFCVAATACT